MALLSPVTSTNILAGANSAQSKKQNSYSIDCLLKNEGMYFKSFNEILIRFSISISENSLRENIDLPPFIYSCKMVP